MASLDPRHNSSQLVDGPARAAARAQLKGIGFDDEALSKPIIGVASTWTETMPCNYQMRAQAAKIKEGIRDAGGRRWSSTRSRSPTASRWARAACARASSAREVIADSIELVARGHFFDAIVCLAACDKTLPGVTMALARLDLPGLMLYGGSIMPGKYKGEDVTIQEVFEAIGAHAAGRITEQELIDLENVASPGSGACGGQFTANTMAMALEVLGISPMGAAMVPAENPSKAEVAYETGKLVMDVLARGQRPSDIITKAGLENAIAAVATSGGSTNGVLHLLAIASEAGVDLDIDDFDRISSATPMLCDLKPGGRYVAADLHQAGGVPVVVKRLQELGRLNEDAMTVTGRTVGEHAAEAQETEGQVVVRPVDDPIKASAASRSCAATSRPTAAS
jgi:dihydroxy-acid dehydratase